jgi:hypothetical protein
MSDSRPHSDPGSKRPRHGPLTLREISEQAPSLVKKALWGLAVVAVIGAITALLVSIPYITHDALTADLGDCVSDAPHVVSCASPKAVYRVVGIISGDRETGIEGGCASADMKYQRGRGKGLSGGFTLCLSLLHKPH